MTSESRSARSHLEHTDALVTVGHGVNLSDAACVVVWRYVDRALRMAGRNDGAQPVLPPDAAAVLMPIRARALRYAEQGSPLVALHEGRSSAPCGTTRRDGRNKPQSGLGAPVVGTGQAAEAWGLGSDSATYVRRLARVGRLPATQGADGRWLLDADFVDAHHSIAAAIAAHERDHEDRAA